MRAEPGLIWLARYIRPRGRARYDELPCKCTRRETIWRDAQPARQRGLGSKSAEVSNPHGNDPERSRSLHRAQFVGDAPPFDTLPSLAQWAAALGFKGLQLPTNDSRYFDLAKAAASKGYCDDLKGMLGAHGLAITDLSTHLQGQLLAVHPAFAPLFDGFAPAALRGKRAEQQAWARDQLLLAAKASANLGLSSHATFSGALLWHLFYPWPQRPPGIVDDGFKELASRWRPILDAFDALGVDLCYELHPGEDLHDGVTFERFLEATGNHPRANILFDPSHFLLQQLDYLAFIDRYHARIRAFHVKDAGISPERALRRVRRLPELDRPAGAVSLRRRRTDRLRRDF